MKKLLLSLGAVATTAIPVVAVIPCSPATSFKYFEGKSAVQKSVVRADIEQTVIFGKRIKPPEKEGVQVQQIEPLSPRQRAERYALFLLMQDEIAHSTKISIAVNSIGKGYYFLKLISDEGSAIQPFVK